MEARITEDKDIPFGILENDRLAKKDLSEIKASLDNFLVWMKHETSDIRKELTYLATKQESAEIKYELKESIKALELKLYAFVVKAVVTTIGIVSAIQPLFNFFYKH